MTNHQFNRRKFLRGVGVSMALPWLESRNVWGDERPSGSKASEAPVRLCVTFSGNGFHSKEWWAKGCLLYTSPSPRHRTRSRMPSSA